MTLELTRCPQLNKLLISLDQHGAGSLTDQDLVNDFNQTQSFFDTLSSTFEAQLKMTPPTEILEAETPRFRAAVEAICQGLQLVKEAIETGQFDSLPEVTERLKASTGEMLSSIDRMQAEEAKEAVLSPSPYLNTLMKVGAAVQDGKMETEVFRTMLTQLLSNQQQMVGAVIRIPDHADAERKEQFQASLQQYFDGLQEASLYLQDGDYAHVTSGLEGANQAATKMYALDEAFVASEAATRTKPCMRCGADNDVAARQCIKCQAVLMSVGTPQESSFDVRVEEGVQASGHVMTEITQGLVNMVAAVNNGQRTLDDLAETLNSLELRIKVTTQLLGTVDPDKAAKSPEEVEAMKWAQQMMSTGMTEMNEGIGIMRRALDGVHTSNLDVGMEAFLTGADKMAAVTRAAATMEQTGVAPG